MAKRAHGAEEIAMLTRWLEANDDSRSELLVKELGALISASLGGCHVAPTNSAMAALHLPLQLIGVRPGDEVIVDPVVTFAGMAAMYQNAVPVFADIEPDTFNMSPASVRERITPRTRAIICTHHFGSICAIEEIVAIAREFGLAVIEDCSHALRATRNGVHAGLFGDFAAFSFNHRKQLSTGQGGFLVVNNAEYVDTLARRAFGRIPESLSWNYAMPGIVAALAMAQWPRVAGYVAQDMEYSRRYGDAVAGSPLLLAQRVPSGNISAAHIWAAVYKGDDYGIAYDDFMKTLKGFGGDYFLPSFIPSGTFGLPPSPVYKYPIFRDSGMPSAPDGLCPSAEYVVPRLLNTVLSPLPPERMAKYADALHQTVRHYG